MIPQRSIVASFQSLETELFHLSQVVPYCKEHESVWSPGFASCLLEAGSQLDSLWKIEARSLHNLPPNQNLNIKDYYDFFAARVELRWLVFWADTPIRLWPFQGWNSGAGYTKLSWWEAYNKIKHDRWNEIREATYANATHAIGALFVAINCSEYCREAIAESGWLSARMGTTNSAGWLDERNDDYKWQHFVLSESKLFAYPIGWRKLKFTHPPRWGGPSSNRFKNYFDLLNEVQF